MGNLTAWEKMQLIHEKERPCAADYIPQIFNDIYELHGDRLYGDDKAVYGAVCRLGERPVTVIAQMKGHNLSENKERNFGMMHPEGYRKAMRLMKQAEKFKRPIICFIDTPGAFCGVEAEKRGQGEAIAFNIAEMMQLNTPVISVVLSEGGSGGALGLGVCDELIMMSNALYSVISPRGFASLLWKDSSREEEAADLMKITAQDLKKLGIAEKIIEEPEGGAQKSIKECALSLKESLEESVKRLINKSTDELMEERYMQLEIMRKWHI